MAHFFPVLVGARRLRAVALGLGLLVGPTVAHGQAATTVYGLGTLTSAHGAYATGTQGLALRNSASPMLTTAGPMPLAIRG